MNKRIEKLFNEAGFHKPEMERLGIEHKFEKFAELIIQKCAMIGNYAYDGGEYPGKMIKEYFGVE